MKITVTWPLVVLTLGIVAAAIILLVTHVMTSDQMVKTLIPIIGVLGVVPAAAKLNINGKATIPPPPAPPGDAP